MNDQRPLSNQELRIIANYIKSGGTESIDMSMYDTRVYVYEGYVQPKQRPQKGKGGRFFTPKETREFEKKIQDWGGSQNMDAVSYPLKVELEVWDKTDNPDLRLHSIMGLVYHSIGDLDNKEKAILDGLNRIAYKDDKQIVKVSVKRRYAQRDGFRMTISRAGLSKAEYKNLLKLL